MIEHKCDNCGKIFQKNAGLVRHKNKTFPCKPNINLKNKPQCQFCNKLFLRKYNLERHLKNNCKGKNKQNNKLSDASMHKIVEDLQIEKELMQKSMKDMENKIQELDKLCRHPTINNLNQINIQQNVEIRLNAFGKEQFDYITDTIYKDVINKAFKSIPKLIEIIHFNKDKPENQNVFISNLSNNLASIFDGNVWQKAERNDVLEKLYEDKADLLCNKFEEIKENLKEDTTNKFERFKDKIDDSKIKNQIQKDIKLLLYNNNKMTNHPTKTITIS